MKLLTDIHTHSTHSHDGIDSLENMLSAALSKGAAFYGVSEHFDYDVIIANGKDPKIEDGARAESYFHHARHLQEDYQGALNVCIGAEFGFMPSAYAHECYQACIQKYAPDFIVNSVHCLVGEDYYDGKPYYKKDGSVRDKKEVYGEYLEQVLKSLSVPYHYDIVAHLGYVERYAPYEDNGFYYADFPEQIDEILTTIIKKNKILEVNSNVKGGDGFLCKRDVLKRYYDLGGRLVSYASDAHGVKRILEKRDLVVATLKEIGFTFITVPYRGEYIKIEI